MTDRIYSHVLHKSVLGFKGLFLCHTDGKPQTLLDFSLHGGEGKNPEKKQGLTDKQRKARFSKKRDGDSAVNTHIKKYRQSKTDWSVEMVREAGRKGIGLDYLLVDSWFTCADLFSADEEAIIRTIANDNEKIAIIKKLCSEKKTA